MKGLDGHAEVIHLPISFVLGFGELATELFDGIL